MSLSVWVFWAFCGPGGPVSSFFGYVIHEQDEVRDMADVSFHFLIFLVVGGPGRSWTSYGATITFCITLHGGFDRNQHHDVSKQWTESVNRRINIKNDKLLYLSTQQTHPQDV